MRILYLSRNYTTHDYRFLSSLAKSEHDVFFLRLENKRQGSETRALPEKVQYINWAGGKSSPALKNSLKLLFSLRKVIKNIKPDIIHAGPIQTSGLLAVLSGFRPVVTMSWAYDLLFDANKNMFYRWATRKTLKETDVLIADCETIANLAVEKGFPRERIVIFPWGIDLDQFSPGEDKALRQKIGWVNDEFILFHNRAWEPIYGVEIFANAFVHAANKHPELRLKLLGHGLLHQKLGKIFKKGGVLDKVHTGAFRSQEGLQGYYRIADLYVSASHSDGSSVSLMEALGCGTPVLLSDIPGNKEWITEGKEGWLFKDGDVRDLAQGILHAVDYRKDLRKMGQASRQLAEERADWTKNFKKLLAAYELAKGQYV